MTSKYFMNWSGGKDSALALYKAQQEGTKVEALVTSFTTSTDRVSMHGVRRTLLERQAVSVGMPLYTIELMEMPGMQAYEEAVHQKHQQLKEQGFTHALFGDIFLEDLKKYREELLREDGLLCGFPLWQMSSKAVMEEFISLGFKAIIVCVDCRHLDQSFCGRLIDEAFINDLPPGVDPCGENGEYHSFVFDGPVFKESIHFTKGEIVFKEYEQPKVLQAQDNNQISFTTPQLKAGFYFQDLMLP